MRESRVPLAVLTLLPVTAADGAAVRQAGVTLTITAPNGAVAADLDGQNEASRVQALRAGVSGVAGPLR